MLCLDERRFIRSYKTPECVSVPITFHFIVGDQPGCASSPPKGVAYDRFEFIIGVHV